MGERNQSHLVGLLKVSVVEARSGDWRRTHAVGVAVGCYCDFYQDVCWLEVCRHVDFVDLVRFVELHHLDGFHFLGKFFDAHFDGWCDGDWYVSSSL